MTWTPTCGTPRAVQRTRFLTDLATSRHLPVACSRLPQGKAATHTMPCDALARLRDVMPEAQAYGFDKIRNPQLEFGQQGHTLLRDKGFNSVAAKGSKAPGLVAHETEDMGLKSG